MAMFENLSERLAASLKKISGKASLSESNIEETLRAVRMALLEADVALPVVKSFVEQVRLRALWPGGQEQPQSGTAVSKIVQAELVAVMGEEKSIARSCRANHPR